MTSLIEIPTADGTMPAFSCHPEGEPKGAVIVIQEAFGLTEHIGSIADRLAEAGYRAIAPALFHRVGSPVLDYDIINDAERVTELFAIFESLTAEDLATDVDASLAFLEGEGFSASSIGMVGFCMGGAVTLFASTRPGLGAGVTFYGGGVANGRFGLPPLIEQAPSVKNPWLGLYGDLDASIPVDDVEKLRAAASLAAAPTEIVRYADADHGFNCDGRPNVFNAEAAADAWARTLAFFNAHLRREG